MDFWNTVKSELSYQGLTQKDLANKAELNYRTLQNWIARNIQPDIFSAVKIAKALNVSAEYLLYGDNDISDMETVLLIKFRKLSEEQKKLIIGVVSGLADK